MSTRFDALADSLTRTTSVPATSAFTMMGWFFLSVNRSAFTTFLAHGASTADGYQIGTDAGGTTLQSYNGSTALGGSNLNVGQWYHIAIAVNGTSGSNFVVYLNGAVDITGTARTITTSKIWVANNADSEWFNGLAAAVKIYNVAMTASEIKQEMWSHYPVRRRDLDSWVPCLGDRDARLDYGGNGRHWTVGGTLTGGPQPPRLVWPTPNSLQAARQRRLGSFPFFYLNQYAFRFRADDGSESGATGLAAENVAIARAVLTPARLRMGTDATSDPPAQAVRLLYRKAGDTDYEDLNLDEP